MLAQVTFGREVFDDSGANYGVLASRTQAFPDINPAEAQLWMMSKEGVHGIRRIGGLEKLPAVPGHNELMGKWTTGTYELPEGLLVTVYGRRKLSAMVAGRHTEARVVLRVREHGPLIRLQGNLTGDSRTPASKVLFEGRVDMLTPQEAISEGAQITGLSRYDSPNVTALFTTTELSPELEQRVVVRQEEIKNAEGEVVRVPSAQPRRRLQV